MGRGLSRQVQPMPPPRDVSAPQAPPRAPRRMALDSWFRKVRTRRPLRRVGPENVAVPVDPPSPLEPQGTHAEELSPRTQIIEVRPASKKLPWEASSHEVERKNQTSESAESSFLSEQILTSPKDKQPIELGSKEVGIPSEVLEEGAARALDTESVHEPPQKTSTDSEAATLADIPSLEDEVWDPLPSSSSSIGPSEDEDPALHPRRWSSLDPEQAKQHLHHLCLLVCSSSSAEVTQAVDYVA
nr:PREDICTED: pre-mRNA-splicing ATP-dependent RNA helicase prp28-like [Anolis carolinensis]|eukprot:XP_016848475.1 PREDICTED: pre-mRNA-splicing ATP-dependent RNA helicase prp28-like [Anolis carolinensis]